MNHPTLWIATRGLLTGLRGGVGGALAVAYVSICSLYTFTLYPYFVEGEATLQPMFEVIPFMLTLLASTLTLELVAGERERGQFDVWLASPLSYRALLLGKLGGAWALFLLTTFASLSAPLILSIFTSLHWPSLFTAYIGVVLLGTMYLCIGLWASVWAKSALSAWLTSFSICFSFYMIGVSARFLPPTLAEWSQRLSAQSHFDRLTMGLIDSRDVIYFLGMILFWFALSVETLRHQVNRVDPREEV